MTTGYCTVADVRRALRQAGLPGDAEQDRRIVVDAIAGQAEWVRSRLGAHFYETGGIAEDSDNIVPTGTRSHGTDDLDIPSTPHPQHSTLFNQSRGRYPHRTNGRYVRMGLSRQDVDSLTVLDVRQRDGDYDDWVASSDKTQGDDYRVVVEDGGARGPSYLELDAGSLPPLSHYDHAVRASYDYGRAELPRTVRRGVAFRAAADLAEDAAIQIPNNVEVYSVDSLAEELRDQAMELLEPYGLAPQ